MLHHTINLFYPRLCASCKQPLVTGQELLCTACRMQLPYTNFESFTSNPVAKTFWGRVPLEAAGALFYYQKNTVVQALLHELKYRQNAMVAEVFGAEMAKSRFMLQYSQSFEAILPVPMHKSKLKERGYNQSELLAQSIANSCQLKLDTHTLQKHTATKTQTHKNRFERWMNKQEDFVAAPLTYTQILLVDDVITTGATLEACCMALTKANPNLKISVLAMAYAYR